MFFQFILIIENRKIGGHYYHIHANYDENMLELAPLQVLILKLEQIDCVGGENTQAPYIVAKSNN
ncbi:hypothetical protein F5ESL0263_02525 [Lactobacillus sp. ESL0263]|nr:hypothetical protein F5ESL0263_02525 [Lactobacillus sp. ESL0263]